MQKLVEEVKELVEREYGRAGVTFGLSNHSDHESFAIIMEELDEAGEEFDSFFKQLGLFWALVKSNASDNEKFNQLKRMEVTALLAACEMIQVAAMAKKAAITVCDRGAVREFTAEEVNDGQSICRD